MISPVRFGAHGPLRRALPRCFPIALALAATVASAQGESADVAPAADRRTAILLFVSSPGEFVLPIAATEARRSTSAAFEAALGEIGQDILGALELEPILRRYRIRSENDLRPKFLQTLANDYGVGRLAVMRAVLSESRGLFLARALDPRNGLITWTGTAEIVTNAEAWQGEATTRTELARAATAAATEIAAQWGDRSAENLTGTMVLLPLLSNGLGRETSEVTALCLLHSLHQRARWSIPDPALVMGALQLARLDPMLLNADSRRELTQRFAADAVLVPRLSSFPAERQRSTTFVDSGDGEGPSIETVLSTPVYLTLSLVDCGTGEIVAGRGAYLKPEDPLGIFGTMKEIRLMNRIQSGTDRVVRALFARERDH